jgi:hypothetical protein
MAVGRQATAPVATVPASEMLAGRGRGERRALALWWETHGRCPRPAPVLVVHDNIVIECDAADVDVARAWLVHSMTRGMPAFLTRVPVVVETTTGRDRSMP